MTKGEQRNIVRAYVNGAPAAQVGSAFGVSTGTVLNYVRAAGHCPRRPGPADKPGRKFEDRDGYIRVYMGKRRRPRVMMEHRLVMEEQLGRKLRKGETVHHLNGDRKDNRATNLELRHGAHGPGAALQCAQCGSRDIKPVIRRAVFGGE